MIRTKGYAAQNEKQIWVPGLDEDGTNDVQLEIVFCACAIPPSSDPERLFPDLSHVPGHEMSER